MEDNPVYEVLSKMFFQTENDTKGESTLES